MEKCYGAVVVTMDAEKLDNTTVREYRILEADFHRSLMKVCRSYINDLGIISMTGILDIVKQEVIDLEKATKRKIKNEMPRDEDPVDNTGF